MNWAHKDEGEKKLGSRQGERKNLEAQSGQGATDEVHGTWLAVLPRHFFLKPVDQINNGKS